jgi:hypothetical protein
LSRITKFRTDQNNRQPLSSCTIALDKPSDFLSAVSRFFRKSENQSLPAQFCLYTKGNLYLSHQQTSIPLNGSAQERIQDLFLLNSSTWQPNLVLLTRYNQEDQQI